MSVPVGNTIDLPQVATPATPAAGRELLYFKSDGKLYCKTPGGTEVRQVDTSDTIAALTAPTADFSMNTHKVTNVTDPTAAQDVATKNYVDTTNYDAKPAWHGLKAWSFDPAVINSNTTIPTGGVLNLVKIWCPVGFSATALYVYVQGVASGLTNVGFGLYDSSSNLLQSSVNANGATTTAFTSNGLKTITITSQAIASGAAVYVGFWFTGTTMPTLARGATVDAKTLGQTTPNLRFATSNTGLTTTAPNPSGAQAIAAAAWWAGIS